MNTSILSEELAPLNAQIEQTKGKVAELESDLRVLEAELETFSTDKKRFDALRDVCDALDRLGELGAGELFWADMPQVGDAAGLVQQLRNRMSGFEEEIQEVLQKQKALETQISRHLDELDYLYEEVREAYGREERRQEEFVIEREVSPIPYRLPLMPWTHDGESERRFRRALLVAMFWSLLFGCLIPLVNLPIPEHANLVAKVPPRLAMLVKKEPPRPEPVPHREEKKPKPAQEKSEHRAKPQNAKKSATPRGSGKHHRRPAKEERKAGSPGGGTRLARNKAERSGVLAFKSTFKDLMKQTPVAKLGTEARIRKKAAHAAGQARAHRSLVATEAKSGASGGISNFGVSRNLGSGGGGSGGNGIADRIGGVGFTRVKSSVEGLKGEARPLSGGPGPGRTDEEIQIVFDRYKATLYRIYNRALRKNPTLRGKMLLRIAIEPNGRVSLCKVESTDLASPELVAKVVARVKGFNFGAKEGVPETIILYPIDFLPAT